MPEAALANLRTGASQSSRLGTSPTIPDRGSSIGGASLIDFDHAMSPAVRLYSHEAVGDSEGVTFSVSDLEKVVHVQEERLLSTGNRLRNPNSILAVENYVMEGSNALRSYKTPHTASANNFASTTYSRRPKMVHHVQKMQATPFERIASNYSPLCRGLSPRTLDFIAPGVWRRRAGLSAVT